MKCLLISFLTLSTTLVYAQDEDLKKTVGDIFGTADRDPLGNLVEVTSKPPESLGALEKCGEGSQDGLFLCVPYHQCDGNTKMIIQDGSASGSGIIDIRFGANSCEHFLDVCCGIPPGFREPVSEIPVDPSVTPSRPPVTPVIPPVTPVYPPVTPSVIPSVTTSTPRPSSVYCGIRNNIGIDFKITGNSNEAEYGEFPWMVALLRTNYDASKNQTLSICGGSLLAPNVVLTGAHCVANLQPNQYKVRAGEWDTQTTKERLPYQERNVIRAITHEKFDRNALYNNVALLILETPFDQADNIGTICLPEFNEVITSRNCFASGWGKNVFGKAGNYQVILKKIELPIVNHDSCQKALRRTRLGQIFMLHSSFVCAGGELGKDTCTGDGGSPLVCPDSKNPGRYVQAGIVSWGIGCGEENVPGVYANVAKFRDWIDNQLSRLNVNSKPYTV